MIWRNYSAQFNLVLLIFINYISQGQILLLESNYKMKVNSIPPSVRQGPKNKHQKALLEQVKDSLLKLDWPKHPTLFSKLRELTGHQEQIVRMLGECIERNSRNPYLINYLYVIDYLLTLQSFNMILHHYLVQLYCDLFKHLLWQKHYEALQTLKIMRKYWLPKIDFNLYAHIHQAVIKHFHVNIDWIQEEALTDLKMFYLEHLRMNINDLYFHLPQLKMQDSQPPKTQKKVIYKPNQIQRIKLQEKDSKTQIQPTKEEKIVQLGKNQKLESSIQVQGKEKMRPHVELLKRKREESEETSIGRSIAVKKIRYDYSNIGQFTHQRSSQTTNKQSHIKNCNRQKVIQRGPAKGFNFLLTYSCSLCLMKFKQPSELEGHKAKGCKVEADEKAKEKKRDCISIKEQDISSYTRTCRICYKQLETEYQNGNWLVYDSIKLTIFDVDTLIHLNCQKQVTPEMKKKYQDQQQEANQ